MTSQRRRWPRLVVAMALACVLAGCTEQVAGSPVAVSGASSAVPSGDLEQRALSPADFPAQYPAVRVPPPQAADILADIAGSTTGAQVSPAECAPAPISAATTDTVVVTGMSGQRGNLTVVTTRARTPLADLADTIAACGRYSVDVGGVRSSVTVQLLPPAPVDAPESLAYRRTTTSGTGDVALTETATVLAAQGDGLRVYAAFVSFSAATPDGAALDEVFTAAVRRALGR